MPNFLTRLPRLRQIQRDLMTDVCTITRHGDVVATDVPCRKHKDRLFSEPGDPQDANVRSTQEWGVTMPVGTGTEIGDIILFPDLPDVTVLVGEILKGDTWQVAERAWGTEPKVTTPEVTVTLWRYDATLDDYIEVGPVTGHVIYDRVQPQEAPVRYAPSGQAVYKGGTFSLPLGTDIRVADRFTIEDATFFPGQRYGCVVTQVLPLQPQHIEAKFDMDISGARSG